MQYYLNSFAGCITSRSRCSQIIRRMLIFKKFWTKQMFSSEFPFKNLCEIISDCESYINQYQWNILESIIYITELDKNISSQNHSRITVSHDSTLTYTSFKPIAEYIAERYVDIPCVFNALMYAIWNFSSQRRVNKFVGVMQNVV